MKGVFKNENKKNSGIGIILLMLVTLLPTAVFASSAHTVYLNGAKGLMAFNTMDDTVPTAGGSYILYTGTSGNAGWNPNYTEDDPLTVTADVALKAKVNKKVETCSVSVTVYDDSYAQLEGATVKFEAGGKTYTGITDENGYCYLTVSKNVEGILTISADGYEDATKSVKYTKDSGNDEYFHLDPKKV